MSTKDDREKMLSGNDRRPRREREGKAGEEKKSVKKRVRNIFLIFLGLVFLVLLGIYIAGVVHFKDRFFLHTTINGFDASEMTVNEVEDIIAEKIGSYKLEIAERGGSSETITAEQINYHYVSQGETQAFKQSQNIFLWPLCLWNEISYTFNSSAQYDEEMLTQAIKALACLDESNVTAPQDAYIDFMDGKYLIIPETEGNRLDSEKVTRVIREAVDFANAKVSLEEKNCYQTPQKRQEDETLNATCEKLNTLISTSIVYLFGDNTEALNGDTVRGWISYDENSGDVNLNEDAVREFVAQLASKYDTADKPREFKTHDGRTVTVSGGYYGWVIDQEGETAELLECIRNGYQGDRYAVFAQTAVSWENSDLGYDYVEIDLGNLHVWMYIDGEEIVSTDCVSGDMMQSDRTTPAGTYTLYYKESPSVLEDEAKTYRTEVTYWMPFNGGIGLHDATWRGSFGGNINQSDGSHGCINLPLEAAKTIYENIYAGMPIICYY